MNSNCTYAAWQKAKDLLGIELPAWGNAYSWYSNAQAAGYSVGTTPRANSIVCFKAASWNGNYGHVAFVSDYNASTGQIYKLEGNYNGSYHEGWAPAWESDMYGYIYLSSAPTSVSVNFSNWENSNYTFIDYTNAAIGQQIDVSGGSATDCGMVLYTSGGSELARANNGSFYYRVYFNINTELGYTLSPGTTYQYRFYAIVNGKTYWSGYQSFTTKASSVTVKFSSWTNDNYTFIGTTNASIGQQIDVSGGTATDTGIVLYDKNRNKLAEKANGSYYYRVYFNINNELGYRLTEGTTYQYRFYVVVNGKTYWGSYQTFTTAGNTSFSVKFSTWENGNYTFIGETNAAIGQQIDVTGGNPTDSGMVLYNYNRTELARANNNTFYYRVYFNINTELGYTLSPGTTYYYRFFAVIDGTTYWSDYQSFRTNGSHSHTTDTTVMPAEWNKDGKITSVCKICGETVSSSTISKIAQISQSPASLTYNGSSQFPSFAVLDGNGNAISSSYYKVSYKSVDSVNAGSYEATLTFSGNYKGSRTVTYVINQASVAGATTKADDLLYTGSPLTPIPSVTVNGKTLLYGTDFTVSYSSNTNAGTAYFTVTGMGNYAGSITGSFRISAASLANATVTVADQSYSGSALKPAVTVSLNGKTLTSGVDYTVAYSNNTNVGTATVTVTGKGNYSGTASGSFKIVAGAHAPGWAKENGGYYYYENDGSLRKSTWISYAGSYYYLGSDGRLVTNGWASYQGKWYFMGSNGRIVTNSWVKYGGAYYYLNSSGNPVVNGWVPYGSSWYYMDANGNPVVNSWIEYNGTWYHFNASGVCDNSWKAA